MPERFDNNYEKYRIIQDIPKVEEEFEEGAVEDVESAVASAPARKQRKRRGANRRSREGASLMRREEAWRFSPPKGDAGGECR